jgi:hypothetical protein
VAICINMQGPSLYQPKASWSLYCNNDIIVSITDRHHAGAQPASRSSSTPGLFHQLFSSCGTTWRYRCGVIHEQPQGGSRWS